MTVFHRKYKGITASTARAWGKWIGARYRDVAGIVWSMTPVAEAESIPLLRELVARLKEGDRGGRHLFTAKPDPSPYSSSFMRGEGLLNFNSIPSLLRSVGAAPSTAISKLRLRHSLAPKLVNLELQSPR